MMDAEHLLARAGQIMPHLDRRNPGNRLGQLQQTVVEAGIDVLVLQDCLNLEEARVVACGDPAVARAVAGAEWVCGGVEPAGVEVVDIQTHSRPFDVGHQAPTVGMEIRQQPVRVVLLLRPAVHICDSIGGEGAVQYGDGVGRGFGSLGRGKRQLAVTQVYNRVMAIDRSFEAQRSLFRLRL